MEAAASPKEGEGLREAPVKGCKAVIGPHAGYSYSGPAAAFAYSCIDIESISRVFVLGPSHHVYLDGCALSQCQTYEAPVGQLPLDLDTINELKKTGKFELMDQDTDEAEHSIEMHLPYIRKVFEGRDIRIVPILVGSISTASEKTFGRLLAPYLADPSTLFVISSDFCHWGTRFRYTHFHPPDTDDVSLGRSLSSSTFSSVIDSSGAQVWQGIEKLDKLGMEAISFDGRQKKAGQAHDEFAEYLRQTRNTICGRHPIGVLLAAVAALDEEDGEGPAWRCEWVRYEQSSRVKRLADSSVSYASAFAAQRLFHASPRFLADTGLPPTTSESSMGTDRGKSLPADAQEGAQQPTLGKTAQTTNTSASSAVNDHADPAHPNKAGDESVAAHSRGQTSTASDSLNAKAGANPLKPGGARGYHSSAVRRNGTTKEGSKPAEEQSAQHPGKSDIDHLENPSLSEEIVHADRDALDPLKKVHAAAGAAGAASSAAEQVKDAANKAANAVKDAASTLTGQKRSYHSSAVRRSGATSNEGSKPVEEQSAQHPGKSGHDHLENPSMSEETVHADRTHKDPLPDQKKAGRSKSDGKGTSRVSPAGQPEGNIEDLPDEEATRRSMESASRV
ncbi:memo-related protein [Rhodotorula toruloides]|uniref:Memo-related protein n=1 Tax=Rhodotorula toruloides TaxID=5286 RepID=A0A511KPV8_RHOTO|nr:memo-related protein [Rhodotorula toruloides]